MAKIAPVSRLKFAQKYFNKISKTMAEAKPGFFWAQHSKRGGFSQFPERDKAYYLKNGWVESNGPKEAEEAKAPEVTPPGAKGEKANGVGKGKKEPASPAKGKKDPTPPVDTAPPAPPAEGEGETPEGK